MGSVNGSGTGIIILCLGAPDSIRRTISICVGIAMILIGWVKKSRCDKVIIKYLEKQDSEIFIDIRKEL